MLPVLRRPPFRRGFGAKFPRIGGSAQIETSLRMPPARGSNTRCADGRADGVARLVAAAWIKGGRSAARSARRCARTGAVSADHNNGHSVVF